MRLSLKQPLVPLWAIFCSVSLIILRFYRSPLIFCEDRRNEISYESNYRPAAENTSLPPVESAFPFHPFEKGLPKLVVILTYQRCGSTFFGQLFNENPDAFYMFEPLDSLYSSIYGTKQGWNVPSDITNYRNGSSRILPKEEIDRVSQFLVTLFSCDVESLPTETLVHRYFVQFSTEFLSTTKYVRCVKRFRIRVSKCATLIPSKHCGARFGEKSEDVLTDCRRAMTEKDYRSSHQNSSMFDEYLECMNHIRELVDEKCSPIWQSSCAGRSLRAVKLVRGTMDSMETLLRVFPNFRVIHLIRDPRAVVLSRKRFDSSARGMFTDLNHNQTLTREAFLYCSMVVRDVRRRAELEASYPGKIFPVIYDDVVRNIKGYIRSVYGFLGLSVPHDVWSWYRESDFSRLYGARINSTAVASKWQDVITVRQNKEIENACEEFFQIVKYNWVK